MMQCKDKTVVKVPSKYNGQLMAIRMLIERLGGSHMLVGVDNESQHLIVFFKYGPFHGMISEPVGHE